MLALAISLGFAWFVVTGFGVLLYKERQARDLERAHLLSAFTLEREVWARERRDLNNRIQVPEAAPFLAEDDSPDAKKDDLPVLPEFVLDEEELERAKAELEAVGYSEGPVA